MIRRSVVCVLVAVGSVATPAASAAPRWAPASKATIHPGVRVSARGSTCAANFVFYDSRYVYLGLAASCSPPWGAKVKIEGASRPGTIAYDSGVTGCCGQTNDFALARLDNADKAKVNPSVPFWGGPASGAGRSSTGKPVYSYGNSASPSASTDRTPKVGVDTSAVETDVAYADLAQEIAAHVFRGDKPNGWTHYAQMVSPATGNYECQAGSGLCGADLGAPVLDARGRALGILGPWAYDFSNRVTDLSKAIAYMKWKTSLDGVRLATGTTAFVPPA